MKNLGISVLFITALLLGGCTIEEKESEVPVEEGIPNVGTEIEDLGQALSDGDEGDKSHELDESYLPIENILVDKFTNQADYILDNYWQIGESANLNYGSSKDGEWELSLLGYSIEDDELGSERKALVLNFEHTNIKRATGSIEGFFDLMDPNIIYNNMKLGLQDATEAVVAYNENSTPYNEGNRILYGDYVTESTNCKRVWANEGETKKCYTYYSYAGPGEYLINFKDENGKIVTYSLDVD